MLMHPAFLAELSLKVVFSILTIFFAYMHPPSSSQWLDSNSQLITLNSPLLEMAPPPFLEKLFLKIEFSINKEPSLSIAPPSHCVKLFSKMQFKIVKF